MDAILKRSNPTNPGRRGTSHAGEPTPHAPALADGSAPWVPATEWRAELVARLAPTVAHELANVLQVLSCALDNLEVAAQDPRSAAELRSAHVAIHQGISLARQLLRLSRPNPSTMALAPVGRLLVEWRPLLQNAVGRQRNLEVEIHDVGWARVDADRLLGALINLCVNARDATASGGRVMVRLFLADLDGTPGIAISVADDGVGMTGEVLSQATEPFFTTKTMDGCGAGLGMFLAKQAAELHGGRLSIESSPCNGSTISIWLPAATEAPI